jgi:hypothetical protein
MTLMTSMAPMAPMAASEAILGAVGSEYLAMAAADGGAR